MYKLICTAFESTDCDNILSSENIDMVFADPPDNCGVKYENCNDSWDEDTYANLLDQWIQKCCKITNGPVLFSFNEKWTDKVEWSISHRRIPLIQRCYWHYTFGQNQKHKYTPSVRPIYWLNSQIFYSDNIKQPSARQIKYNDKRAKDGG